jgi:hypothetical protein
MQPSSALGTVVALAGRRIDPEGAVRRQFPLENLVPVRRRIESVLIDNNAQVLVCSAACGADLLALESALQLRIKVRVILPYSPDTFRVSSVIDRPGDWGPLFDHVLSVVKMAEDLIVLSAANVIGNPFTATNKRIVAEAIALAKGRPVVAIAVWEGRPRGPEDVTAQFMRAAELAGCTLRNIPTC